MALKRWNGSSQIDVAGVRRWTGTEWKLCDFVRRWNGSSWIDVWRGITVAVSGFFNQVNMGFNSVADDGTFSVTKFPVGGDPITAYQWDYVDYGGGLMLMSSNTTSSTLRLRGPAYGDGGFNPTYQVDIWCTVTIGGVQYTTPQQSFQYTAGLI